MTAHDRHFLAVRIRFPLPYGDSEGSRLKQAAPRSRAVAYSPSTQKRPPRFEPQSRYGVIATRPNVDDTANDFCVAEKKKHNTSLGKRDTSETNKHNFFLFHDTMHFVLKVHEHVDRECYIQSMELDSS